ncbi:MAG: T9SS type A sorting domain-containing protein [Bacteroidaceae bacterium]|jgi:hypothetical protein|nr:T9SS type A sorting domain-containing protein [Bacteroidaceae bacterium]
MKKILLIALAVGSALCAHADSYNFLNLTSASTTESVAMKKVKRITFEGTNIVVTTTDGTTTTAPLNTLTKLTFTADPLGTGVGSLQAQAGRLCIQAGRIIADGVGELQLYNASGQLVRRQTITRTHAELSLDGLSRGIYIARFGQQTLKLLY